MTTLQTAFVLIASVSGATAAFFGPEPKTRLGFCLSLLGIGVVCLAAAVSLK